MPFTPPVFDLFRVNTVNLDVMLSRQFGRYIIVAEEKPSEASSSQAIAVPQSSLEVLLARTHHKVVVGTTDRTTQQAVFKQLSNELREILKENNESKNKKATMFLLGALLHRYFRLIKEYDNYNYLFTIYDVRNCDLFKAIRAALHLPAEMPDGFKANDLAVLDVVTIVDSLHHLSSSSTIRRCSSCILDDNDWIKETALNCLNTAVPLRVCSSIISCK